MDAHNEEATMATLVVKVRVANFEPWKKDASDPNLVTVVNHVTSSHGGTGIA